MATKKTAAADAALAKQAEAKRRAEDMKKYPHQKLEARYANPNLWFIMSGADEMAFRNSEFFAGFHLQGMQLVPKWVRPQDDAAAPLVFFTREAAHKAMTELLEWYEGDGVRSGVKKPEDLCIGY